MTEEKDEKELTNEEIAELYRQRAKEDEHYTTPPGVMEQRIPAPPGIDIENLPKGGYFTNWRGHAFYILPGSTSLKMLNEIQGRRNRREALIFMMTGEAGSGKTWFMISFGLLFDPKFYIADTPAPDPAEDRSQVVFEREHLLYLIGNNSPLKQGSCIILDEAQYSVGNRNWFQELQKDLSAAMQSVRSRGLMIVIIALHRKLIDVSLRDYVLSFHWIQKKRGEAILYRTQTPQFGDNLRYRRRGSLILPVPNNNVCSNTDCLSCKWCFPKDLKKRCQLTRARYERRKREFVGKQSSEAQDRARAKRVTKKSRKELVALAWEHREKVGTNKLGNAIWSDVQDVLEELGEAVGDTKAQQIARNFTKLLRKEDDNAGVGL